MTSWIFATTAEGDRPLPQDVLSVTFELHDAHTVVGLEGPLCAYTADLLATELRTLEDAGRHRLVIDASRVEALCLDGVDVLLAHQARCVEHGGDLVIRDPRPGALRVLEVLGLEHLAAEPATTSVVPG